MGQVLFGDGAAAVIIGLDPVLGIERPLFELVSASQTILPDSDGAIDRHLCEVGLTFHLITERHAQTYFKEHQEEFGGGD